MNTPANHHAATPAGSPLAGGFSFADLCARHDADTMLRGSLRLLAVIDGDDDDDFYRAVSDLTTGLGDYPTPFRRASTLTRRTGTPVVHGEAHRLAKPDTEAREGMGRPSLADDGEVFDLRFVPAEHRDDTRDYLCRHDLAWKEPCADCDADMERVGCPDCEGAHRGRQRLFLALDEEECDRCAGHGWLMRCTGCLCYDDDPRVLAAERRALGMGEEADRGE